MSRSSIALTLLLTLLSGLTPVAAQDAVWFADVPPSAWFATYVTQAAELGIVAGYADAQGNSTHRFGPADKVTVTQALKMAIVAAGYPVESSSGSCGGHWADKYIAIAIRGAFFPFTCADSDRPATRAEVAGIVAGAFLIQTSSPPSQRYTDVSPASLNAYAIEALSEARVLSGDTDAKGQPTGRFRPTDGINRAEAAKIAIVSRLKYGQPGRSVSSSQAFSESSSSPAASSVSSSSSSFQSSQSPVEVSISYTDVGFQPGAITVPAGAIVTFTNSSHNFLLVASNPHPVHTDLPDFNAQTLLPMGATYSYTFTQKGDWGYHNHRNVGHSGVVHVQ